MMKREDPKKKKGKDYAEGVVKRHITGDYAFYISSAWNAFFRNFSVRILCVLENPDSSRNTRNSLYWPI